MGCCCGSGGDGNIIMNPPNCCGDLVSFVKRVVHAIGSPATTFTFGGTQPDGAPATNTWVSNAFTIPGIDDRIFTINLVCYVLYYGGTYYAWQVYGNCYETARSPVSLVVGSGGRPVNSPTDDNTRIGQNSTGQLVTIHYIDCDGGAHAPFAAVGTAVLFDSTYLAGDGHDPDPHVVASYDITWMD